MTVIGSVEFEASLSLDKFNKDLNNLIAKNKALTLPVNVKVGVDNRTIAEARKQFEQQIKNDKSLCIPLKFCDSSILKAKEQLKKEFKDFCIPLKFCKENLDNKNKQKSSPPSRPTGGLAGSSASVDGGRNSQSLNVSVTNPVSVNSESVKSISTSLSKDISKSFQDVLKTTTIKSNVMGSLVKFDILKTVTSPITGVVSSFFKDISTGVTKGVNEKIAAKVGSVEKMTTTLIQNSASISEIVSETPYDKDFISSIFDKIYDLAVVRFVVAEGKYKSTKSSQSAKKDTYETGRVQLLKEVAEGSVKRKSLVERQSQLPSEISDLNDTLSKVDLKDIKKVESLLATLEQKQEEMEIVNKEIEEINNFIVKMIPFLQGGKVPVDMGNLLKYALAKKDVAQTSADAMATTYESAGKIEIPEDLKLDIDQLGIPESIKKIEQELFDLQEAFTEAAKNIADGESIIKSGLLSPEEAKDIEQENTRAIQSAQEIEKKQAKAREKISLLQTLQKRDEISPETIEKAKTELKKATVTLEDIYDQIGYLSHIESANFEAEIAQSDKKRAKKKKAEDIDKKTTSLPAAYVEIAKEVVKASGTKLKLQDIPTLKARPKDASYGALYQSESNSILVKPAIIEKLKEGINLSVEEIEMVVHELRHAVQHGFGKEQFLNPLVSDEYSLQPSTPEEIEQLKKGITFSSSVFAKQDSDTESATRRKNEVDAYTFAKRNAEKIQENINRNILLKKLESRVGYAGGGITDKRLQDGTGVVISRFVQLKKEATELANVVDITSEHFENLRKFLSNDYFDTIFGMVEKIKEKSANSLAMSSDELKPVVDFVEFFIGRITEVNATLGEFVTNYSGGEGVKKAQENTPPSNAKKEVEKRPRVEIPLVIPEMEPPQPIEIENINNAIESINNNFQELEEKIGDVNEFLADFPQLDLGDLDLDIEEDLSKWDDLNERIDLNVPDNLGEKLKTLEDQVVPVSPVKVPSPQVTATPENIKEIKTPDLSSIEKAGVQKFVSKHVQKNIRSQLKEIRKAALSSEEKLKQLQELEEYINGNIKALNEVSKQSKPDEKTVGDAKKNIRQSLNGQLTNLKNLLKQTQSEIEKTAKGQTDIAKGFGMPKQGSEMLGIGAGIAGISSFFGGGAAQAATVGSATPALAGVGATVAASPLLPIAATIGGGAISLAIVKKIRPLVEREAPNIAKVLYFDLGNGFKAITSKIKDLKDNLVVNAKMALLGAEIKEGNRVINSRVDERIKKVNKTLRTVNKAIDQQIKEDQADLITEAKINAEQINSIVETSKDLGGSSSVDDLIGDVEKRRSALTNRQAKKVEKKYDLPRSQEIDFSGKNTPDFAAITTGILGELSNKVKVVTGTLKGYFGKIQESIDKKIIQSSYLAAQDAQNNLLPALQAQIARIKQAKSEVESLKTLAEGKRVELAKATEQALKESKYRSVGVSRMPDDAFDALLAKLSTLQEELAATDAKIQSKESDILSLPELVKTRDEIMKSVSKISGVVKKKTVDKDDINTLKQAREALAEIYSVADEQMPGGGFLADLSFALDKIGESAKNAIKGFLGFTVFNFFQNQLQSIASQTFEVTKRFQVLENTINFLSGGTKAGAAQMQFLRSEINRTSSAIEPALQSYKKLAASTRNTPLEGKVTNDLTSALMQAGTVFGLTGEELEGSILAISQVAGKGVVSLEELRGQLSERIPGAFQIAARSMGVTEQELYKLISTGQLAATDFLPKFAAQLSSETAGGVAGASNTVQASLTRLNNAITEIQVSAGKEFQGGLVVGMNALSGVLQVVSKHAGTFVSVLQIAAGVALTYAFPAVVKLAQGLMAIPMASFIATKSVLGLKDAIMTMIVPTIAQFATTVAVVWLAVEAFKMLADVWDTFTSKTQSQVWSETLSKNLQKNKQETRDLWKEIERANKTNLPKKPGDKYETEFSSLDKQQRDKLKNMSFPERISYAFSSESMQDEKNIGDALKQTIKDSREIKTLQRDRVSGALKGLKDTIDSSSTQENIKRLKDYNAQIEQLRQKASLTTDPGSQKQIKDQVEQVRELRNAYGNDLAYSMTEVNVQIENRQKRIKETNDDKLREELRLDLVALQAMKEQLQEVERQTGAQTTLSELMQVLSRLRVEMEMFNRVAQELADKNLRAIAETELQGLRTDIFASADAGLKRSENALELVRNKINISKNTVKELQQLLQDPMMGQYTEFYKGNSLEQLKVDLEGVDEADTQRRKALEAMILLREQESGLIGLQREEAESLLSLEKERSQAVLNRFDQFKAEAQNKVQIGESQALTGITKGQLKGKITPTEVDRMRAEVSLKTAKQNQELVQKQLETIQNYYREGKITAEDFANRRRELELQVAQSVQQVAEQELQLRQSVQQEIINQIEKRVAIANALQQQGENAAVQAIRQQQLDRVITEQQAEVKVSEIRKKSLTENYNAVQQQLSDLRDAYNRRKIEETEFRQRERDLITQSSDLSRQLVEQDLQIRQQKQQLLLDQLDRENTKLEHQLKLRELVAQLRQKTSQIKREVVLDTRTREGEDAQTRITRQTEDETLAIQRQTSTLYAAELQRRLSTLQDHYRKGEISQREYEDRSRQLEQELTSTTVQLKDYELQQHQRINQRIAEDRDRLYRRMIEDFERATKKQENILQLSATRQEQRIRQQQLGQIDLIGSQRAEQQAAIALTKIQEEQTKKQLKATLQQIQEVAQLKNKKALTEKEAEDRTADLTQKAEQLRLDLINKQIEKSRQLKDLKILALDDELTRIDTIFQKQEMGLNYELEKRKQIVDSLDRAKSVMESQNRLQQALMRGEEQQRQAALDRSRNSEDLLGRLPDLQKRLGESGLTYQQQRGTQYLRELVQKMSGVGMGNAMLPESQLRQVRTNQYNDSVQAEQRLLEMKTRHLEQQQKIQITQTELQKRMNRLTAENAVMEANISLNKARQAELQAKIALEKARINGDPREIQNAQNAYDLAKQGTQLGQQQVGNAIEKLTTANQLSEIDKQATLVEQANERFSLQEANRKALQETALRGGELASQGAIDVDSMIKIDSEAIQFKLEAIAPVVDLTSQINTKLDSLYTAITGVLAKPTAPSVENLTVVSADPTGDSRQVLDDMTRARNMYF